MNTRLYHSMTQRASELESSIKEKQNFIASSPAGQIKCYKFGGYYRWFISNEKGNANNDSPHTSINSGENSEEDSCSTANCTKSQRRYLSKKDIELATLLAVKGLYEAELRDEIQELNAVKMYLRHRSNFQRGNDYLERNEEFSRLVRPYLDNKAFTSKKAVIEWMQNRQNDSVPYPEKLNILTKAGIYVRSKSERDIANALVKYNLPFKYECKVESDIGPLFPDFTILNPRNGQEIIWEHNGMMDNPEYANRTFRRTAAYYRLGYHPDKNFIMTYEENNEGLDDDYIDAIIRHFFVDTFSYKYSQENL